MTSSNVPIYQSGLVTPRHLAAWTADGVLQDAGVPGLPGVFEGLGILSSNQAAIEIDNAAVSGAYSSLSMGITASRANITSQGFGGGSDLPLDIVAPGGVSINGISYPGPAGPYLPLTGGTLVGLSSSNIYLTPFANSDPFVADTAQVLSQYNTSASGGTPGEVVFSGRFNLSISGAPDAYLWALLGSVDFNGTGGTGQHVGVYGQGVRRTYASGGSANNPQIWGGVSSAIDMTGQNSSGTNALLGHEIDVSANGLDNATNRIGLIVVATSFDPLGTPVVVNTGIGVSTGTANDSFNYALSLGVPYNVAAIDLRTAVENAGHTIWFGDNAKSIAWNLAGSTVMEYDPASFSAAGGVVHAGNFEVTGTLYTPNALVVGGGAELAGGASITGHASVTGGIFSVDGAGNIRFTNQTDSAAAQTATLTNSPLPGNPAFWLPVYINGVVRNIPAW
jgi:hypothetical protein